MTTHLKGAYPAALVALHAPSFGGKRRRSTASATSATASST